MNNLIPSNLVPNTMIYLSETQNSRRMISVMAYTVRRWWFLALLLGIVLAIAAGMVVQQTFQPVYVASMWLRIHSRTPYIVFEDREDSYQFVENQTQLIRSRLVLGGLLSDPRIAGLEELAGAEDKVEAIAERLTVNAVGRSEYFSVGYSGISADTSELVVRKIVDSYLALHDSQGTKQRTEVVNLLEDEKVLRQRKVEQLRKTLAQLVEDSSVNDIVPSPEELSTLAELRKRAVVMEVDSTILKIETTAFEKAHAELVGTPATHQVDRFVMEHPRVVGLEKEILQLEDTLSGFTHVGVGHPSYRRAAEQLRLRRNRVMQLRQELAQQQRDNVLAEREVAWNEQLTKMKSRLSNYEISRNVIASHLAAETESVRRSSGDSLQVEFLRGELEQANDVHDMIARRLLVFKTEHRAPPRVQLLEPGEPAAIPVELMPYRKIAMASLGALAIPFALFFALELLLKRVFNVQQLENSGQLPVIGEVANLPRPLLLGFIGKRRFLLELSLYRESVDQLRTSLVLHESMRTAQVIAVTSAVSREGKTNLSLQLAASLETSTGEPVLILDGDMRYPTAHDSFRNRLTPGLSDVLAGKADWRDAVYQLDAKGPYLLPAGKLRCSPQRLFRNGRFERLLTELQEKYRYIIIDTPPVLAASEAIMMAAQADAFLLCTMQDHSRMRHVRLAYERLLFAGARSMGAVLNGAPFHKYMYRYGLYTLTPDPPRIEGTVVDSKSSASAVLK